MAGNTIDRPSFNALIDRVSSDLTEYLKSNKYCLCNQKKRDELISQYNDRGWGWAPLPRTAEFIFVHSDSFRENLLTAKRIANVIHAQNKLRSLKSSIQTEEVSLEKLNNIKQILNTALERNNNHSVDHKKIHHSYRENFLGKMGIFGSWWHKTWFQSRATTALENALNHLEQFAKKTSLTPQ